MKKRDKFLYFLAIFLSFTYSFSFIKKCTYENKRKSVKTALINKKNIEKITKIELSNKENKLFLCKENSFFGDYWTVQTENTEKIPCDKKRIEKFITELTKVRSIYKISYDKNKINSLYENQNFFCVKYFVDHSVYSLNFGEWDFSQNYRTFFSDKNIQVYEIDTNLDIFLTTNIQHWFEQNLISQQIIGKITKDDIQNQNAKILDLRFGNVAQIHLINQVNENDLLFQQKIELGNKNSILIKIFPSKTDEQFLVRVEYFSSKIEKITQHLIISNWTFNKIKQLN